MSLSHPGSIHLVMKDGRFRRGLLSSSSSSWTIWYAASLDIDFSPSSYLGTGYCTYLDANMAAAASLASPSSLTCIRTIPVAPLDVFLKRTHDEI
uniref:Uncharacterized protein n=1 Tax=Oryza brachyantha TaxID=4533 RepID=J3N0T7_ORYBR